ncbi:MAG: BatA and WFA domain-containing protein [Planctomycetota bacterium]
MTFATPLFLIAMLAGLIPIMLHMINRQKAKTIPFSTLRFLRLSVQRTRKRKYLHDVLLLLLRVAALLLIAIALAGPTISRLGNLLGRKATSAVVLVLDNSASMSTIDEGGNRWDAALRVSEQLLDQLSDGDSVALLLTCGPPRAELDRLYQNQEIVRQTLDECRVSSERADLALRLQAAEKLLADSDAPNKEIYVVTDMQALSWQSLKPAGNEKAADAPPVILVDVHRALLPNVAVKHVELHSAGPVTGVPIQVKVSLQGDQSVAQQRHIELLLDGQVQQTSPAITIAAGGTAEHAFRFTLDQPGIHRGEIRLTTQDASTADDHRFFALTVDPHIPVAIVKPREHEIPYLEDTYYLERALAPVTGGNWAIRTSSLTPGSLASEALAAYSIIYCVNLPAVEAPLANRLRDYVRGGGHLVWICGGNVDPVAYEAMNQQASNELLPIRLLSVREPTIDQPDGWRVGFLDPSYPAFAPLCEPASLYQSILVKQHIEMAPAEEGKVTVLARLDNGDPLLVERAIGSGSVLLLGTSVHVDWSNLPLRPIFLPLVAGLTFHLASAEATQSQLISGTPIVSPWPATGNNGIEVLRPTGEAIRLDVTDVTSDTLRYIDTYDLGIYELHSLNPALRRQTAIAMNLDGTETAQAITTADTLQVTFGERPLVLCADPSDLASTISKLREGESLLEAFLIAVIIALIAESYIANRRIEKEQPEDLRQPQRTPFPMRALPERWDEIVRGGTARTKS